MQNPTADTFPSYIVAEYNDADSAVAKRKQLGDGYVVTPGIGTLYAVRKLEKMAACEADLQADCDHQYRADRIDPFAVRCVRCGKFHRFPKVTLADRANHERKYGND